MTLTRKEFQDDFHSKFGRYPSWEEWNKFLLDEEQSRTRSFRSGCALMLLSILAISLSALLALRQVSYAQDERILELKAILAARGEDGAALGSRGLAQDDAQQATDSDPGSSGSVAEFIKAYVGNRSNWERGKLIADAVMQASEKYGLDPLLLVAVIEQESRFNPDARGSVGEIGLMQVHPGWIRSWARNAGIALPEDPKGVAGNVDLGAAILRRNYTDDYFRAAGKYNGGNFANFEYAHQVDQRYQRIIVGYWLWQLRNKGAKAQ